MTSVAASVTPCCILPVFSQNRDGDRGRTEWVLFSGLGASSGGAGGVPVRPRRDAGPMLVLHWPSSITRLHQILYEFLVSWLFMVRNCQCSLLALLAHY